MSFKRRQEDSQKQRNYVAKYSGLHRAGSHRKSHKAIRTNEKQQFKQSLQNDDEL